MISRVIGERKPLFRIVAHRPAEWMCSFVMIAFACTLLLPGQTFELPTYAGFVAENVSENQVLLIFGGIGMLRIASLMMGGSPRSYRVRQLGAAIGGLCFGAVALTFAEPTLSCGLPLPTGVGTYTVLALFEGLSIRLAGWDRIHGS